MEYKLYISARAEEETFDAVDYYDEINLELGTRFLMELQDIYQTLKSNPQYFGFISSEPGINTN